MLIKGDTMAAIGRSKAKTYSKENTTKKKASTGVGSRGPMTEKRKREKKKYAEMNKSELARAKAKMTSNKAYSAPTFKSAFADARKGGKNKFTWQGKSYHTKTKSELEGAKEKERFARAGSAKTSTSKKGNVFTRFATKLRGGHETQKGYEEARDKRRKEKRIAAIEKRKDSGKSYSAKNLASLKGDTGAKKTWITKKDKKGPWITKKEKKGPWITKKPGRGWRKDVQIPGMKA